MPDLPELSEREREILQLVATGASNKEIGQRLYISANTVKVHLRNIFAKIGVVSRTEAAMYAVRQGLVPAGESLPPVEPPALDTQPVEDESPRITALTNEQEKDLPPDSPSPPPAERPAAQVRMRGMLWGGAMAAVILLIVILAWQYSSSNGRATPFPMPAASPVLTATLPQAELSRWKELAAFPTVRQSPAAVSYENRIYVIGGETSQDVSGIVEIYDPRINSWEQASPKPIAVAEAKAAVIGGKIYVPGGRTASGALTNVLEIYEPRHDTWTRGAALPVAVSAYALATFEGRLYLFGGWDGKVYLDTTYIYEPGDDRWVQGTVMPTARAYAGAAIAVDKILVIGGHAGGEPLAVSEAYLPHLEGQENPWSAAPPMPAGRSSPGVATIADGIYIMGGKDAAGDLPGPILYLASKEQWRSFGGPATLLGEEVNLVSIGEYLYVFGRGPGNDPSGYTLEYQAVYTIAIPIIP